MPFSNTTDKNGIIQACERWCNLGDGGISGDSFLLKSFTADINLAFDEVLPIIFTSDSGWQWDDLNHTKDPIGYTDLVSGQQKYNIIADEQGNSVLEIRKAYIKTPEGVYVPLRAIDEKDQGVEDVLAQNPENAGTPTAYDKLGTALILDKIPDYEAEAGLKVIFGRAGSHFSSTDTTKTPGIPQPFHELLALIPSKKYLAIHKPDNRVLLGEVKEAIAMKKAELSTFLSKRSKDEKIVIRARRTSNPR